VLRKDGNYWFELENRAVTKQDVERLLGRLGVDPNNILIIMHQNMVEQFTVLSVQEKLRIVEAAVGLEPYRENVLQAQRKLGRIMSQEDSMSKLLESAEQTLNYWREQYDRYQEKKQLQTRRRFLERELAWAEVTKREQNVKRLETERKNEKDNLKSIEEGAKSWKDRLDSHQAENGNLRSEWKSLLVERLDLEHHKAANESTVTLCQQLLEETRLLESTPASPSSTQTKVGSQFKLLRTQNVRELIQNSEEQLSKLKQGIQVNELRTNALEDSLDKMSNQIIEGRVELALLQYRAESALINLKKLERELNEAIAHVEEATRKAEQSGTRIAVVKETPDIIDEIRTTDGHLAALADVSEDIERMYESYSKLYLELKQKAQLVTENREKTLEEVKTRMHSWRIVMQTLLDKVNIEYQKTLIQAQAVGEVRLANAHDIEAAGLEIHVGFKGGRPVPLDAYTQSGGERTTATMSFLLALQQHVRSPFRAVDEYDIHMDPKNRELIAQMLVSAVNDSDAQYVVITPSQITFAKEEVNIITVQNIEGKSIVREVV
jgi:chromosome segregation protein